MKQCIYVILGKKLSWRSKKKLKLEMSKERSHFTNGSKSVDHSKESVQINEELSNEGQSEDSVQINEEASSEGTVLSLYLKYMYVVIIFLLWIFSYDIWIWDCMVQHMPGEKKTDYSSYVTPTCMKFEPLVLFSYIKMFYLPVFDNNMYISTLSMFMT